MTNDIAKRLVEHYANRGRQDSFAGKYCCYCPVYLESYQCENDAIAREKELKDWRGERIDALIDSSNPQRKFINAEWCGEWSPHYIWKDYYEALLMLDKAKKVSGFSETCEKAGLMRVSSLRCEMTTGRGNDIGAEKSRYQKPVEPYPFFPFFPSPPNVGAVYCS